MNDVFDERAFKQLQAEYAAYISVARQDEFQVLDTVVVPPVPEQGRAGAGAAGAAVASHASVAGARGGQTEGQDSNPFSNSLEDDLPPLPEGKEYYGGFEEIDAVEDACSLIPSALPYWCITCNDTRRNRMLAHMRGMATPPPVEFVSAVMASSQEVKRRGEGLRDPGGEHTPGVIACFLSHLKLCKMLTEHPSATVACFIEDDVRYHKDFVAVTEALAKAMKPGGALQHIAILSVGYLPPLGGYSHVGDGASVYVNCSSGPRVEVLMNVKNSEKVYGTQAFLCQRWYAEQVLKRFEKDKLRESDAYRCVADHALFETKWAITRTLYAVEECAFEPDSAPSLLGHSHARKWTKPSVMGPTLVNLEDFGALPRDVAYLKRNDLNHTATIITSFVDLSDKLPISPEVASLYLTAAELSILSTPCPMVVFVSEQHVETIKRVRREYGFAMITTIVPLQGYADVPMSKLTQLMRIAFRTQNLRSIAPLPKDTPEYVCTVASKFDWMLTALKRNTFATDKFVWVDFAGAKQTGFWDGAALQQLLKRGVQYPMFCRVPWARQLEEAILWSGWQEQTVAKVMLAPNNGAGVTWLEAMIKKAELVLAAGGVPYDETLLAWSMQHFPLIVPPATHYDSIRAMAAAPLMVTSQREESSAASGPRVSITLQASADRPAGDLAIIVPFFNPIGYQRPLANLVRACTAILKQCPYIDLTVVEAVFPFSQPSSLVPDGPWRRIQVACSSVMFMKENLFNYACKTLPNSITKIAIMDCDLLFSDPNWPVRTSKLLQTHDAVQLFENAEWLERDLRTVSRSKRSCATTMNQHKYTWKAPHNLHPGFAWAFTRKWLTAVGGLCDYGVVGGGDQLVLRYLEGSHIRTTDEADKKNWDMLSQDITMLNALITKAHKAVPTPRVTFLKGNVIRHLYHGELASRQYTTRYSRMLSVGFSLSSLVRRADGIWEFIDTHKATFNEAILAYLRDRNEDA